MAGRSPRSSTRRLISLVAIVLGALLLLMMPLVYFFLALGSGSKVDLPGTFLILTATGGMALLAIGAALYE